MGDPSSQVNAVLLGSTTTVSDGNDAVTVEIHDSVPLFHSHITLLPHFDISFPMEQYGRVGLRIVGYFHANERMDDSELGVVAKNIGDHIVRYFSQAPVLLLDNKKLQALAKAKDMSPVVQGLAES